MNSSFAEVVRTSRAGSWNKVRFCQLNSLNFELALRCRPLLQPRNGTPEQTVILCGQDTARAAAPDRHSTRPLSFASAEPPARHGEQAASCARARGHRSSARRDDANQFPTLLVRPHAVRRRQPLPRRTERRAAHAVAEERKPRRGRPEHRRNNRGRRLSAAGPIRGVGRDHQLQRPQRIIGRRPCCSGFVLAGGRRRGWSAQAHSRSAWHADPGGPPARCSAWPLCRWRSPAGRFSSRCRRRPRKRQSCRCRQTAALPPAGCRRRVRS